MKINVIYARQVQKTTHDDDDDCNHNIDDDNSNNDLISNTVHIKNHTEIG